jgi:hypothetical protein
MPGEGAGGDRRFRFAQFEFPWALGPDPGRYLVRAASSSGASDAEPADAGGASDAGSPTHVLVLASLGAPQRRLLGRRRAREAEPEPDPAPVTTTRATVIESAAVKEAEAARWLAGLDADQREAALREALTVLNRALAGHRLAAADPHVRELGLDEALVARLGHGRGEQVADVVHHADAAVPDQERPAERPAAFGGAVGQQRQQPRHLGGDGGRRQAVADDDLQVGAARAVADDGCARPLVEPAAAVGAE